MSLSFSGGSKNNKHIPDSIDAFVEVVKNSSYQGKQIASPCNVTFFLGAGFSKSWDQQIPGGIELFTLEDRDWKTNGKALSEFLISNGYHPDDRNIELSFFKNIVYQLGMLKKYPSIRPRYLDEQNIAIVERELRSIIVEKFRISAPLYYFNPVSQKLEFDEPLTENQRNILRFFTKLLKQVSGFEEESKMLRAHFITTNYDYTIDAILDNCLGFTESLNRHPYRGLTPKSFSGLDSSTIVHNHRIANNLFKINGGFEIFKTGNEYEIDYRKKTMEEIKSNPPQIMLPSREQDYLQDYFQAIFPKVIRLLQETSVLVIVGYSIPPEDALIRLMLKQFAESRSDGDNKSIFYVDKNENFDKKRIDDIFPHSIWEGLPIIHYQGTFSSWAMEILNKI